VAWTSKSVSLIGQINNATGVVAFDTTSDPGSVPEEVVIVFGNGQSDVWSGPAEIVDVSDKI
jgi:hypothetical protein